MADLEHDIHTWVDRAVEGVEPVTAAEATTRLTPLRPASRHRRGWVAAAAALVLVVAGAVALHGNGAANDQRVRAAADGTKPADEPAPKPSAPATTAPGPEVRLEGAYAGSSTYSITDPSCAGVGGQMQADATLTTGEHWAFDNPTCGKLLPDDSFISDGTFTFTAPDGATLTGTSHTAVPLDDKGGPIDLTITGGTGRYAGATGACQLQNEFVETSFGHQDHDGTFVCTVGPSGAVGTVAVTTLPPTTVPPTTVPALSTTAPPLTVTVPIDGGGLPPDGTITVLTEPTTTP